MFHVKHRNTEPLCRGSSIGEPKMITEQEKVNRLLQEVISEAKKLNIPLGEILQEVKINARAKRRFGCCRSEKKPGSRQMQFTIELSKKVLACKEEKIKEILAHEILHTCPACQNHGKKWKMYAGMMNRAYHYEICTTTSDRAMGLPESQETEKREIGRYFLQCAGCGAILVRKRACPLTRNPERYRCAKCGGKLKILKENPTSSR